MTQKPVVVTPSERKAPLSVVGMDVTVLISAAESKSQRLTIQAGAEGFGPPPHCHGWDESFYVTRGEVQFSCGGQTMICGVGSLVYVPGGVVHAFHFGKGGGEMLEITGTGSDSIPFFTALDRELAPGPPDVPKLLQIADRHGVNFRV